MRTLLLSLCFSAIISFGLHGQSIDLEYIRSNYEHASTDKTLCKKMMEGMEANNKNPVFFSLFGRATIYLGQSCLESNGQIQDF